MTGMRRGRRAAIHHRVSTTVHLLRPEIHMKDGEGGSCGRQMVMECSVQWRDHTLSKPLLDAASRAPRTNADTGWRGDLQGNTESIADGTQRVGRDRHDVEHQCWKGRTISQGQGTGARVERQQPACDKSLRVGPADFHVHCRVPRTTRPPQKASAPTTQCSILQAHGRSRTKTELATPRHTRQHIRQE